MKGQLGVLGRAAAAGLCLICFSLAQTETFKTALPNDTEEIILEQGAWSREQWEEMAVNEEDREFPDAFILWGEKEEVQIVSRDLTRTANVSAIEACGDSRLLLRETVSPMKKIQRAVCSRQTLPGNYSAAQGQWGKKYNTESGH